MIVIVTEPACVLSFGKVWEGGGIVGQLLAEVQAQQRLTSLLCKTGRGGGDEPEGKKSERVSECYHANTKLYSLYLYI